MEGGAKFLKKKQIKHYKTVLRSLRQKHVKTPSAKIRKLRDIAKTLKKLQKLRHGKQTKHHQRHRVLRKTLRRRNVPSTMVLATAVTTPESLKQKYASSHIQPIVSSRSSPSSNLTLTFPSPQQPYEPSENLSLSTIADNNSTIQTIDDITPDLSPIASSIGTDTSVTPASPIMPQDINQNMGMPSMSPLTNTSQGSMSLGELNVPTPNSASPATTVETRSM